MNKLFLLRQSCGEDNYFASPTPHLWTAREGTKSCVHLLPLNSWFARCCDLSVPNPPPPKNSTTKKKMKSNNGRMFSGSPRSSPLDGRCESLRTRTDLVVVFFYTTPTTCLYEFLTEQRMNSRRQRGRRPLRPKWLRNFGGGKYLK